MRFWRTFRLGLLLFVFVGLGFYLGVTTPWGRVFGKLPTYQEEVAEGTPVVEGIYRFRARTGLWPEYLEDLVPGELGKGVSPKWYYTVTSEGPSLARDVGEGHVHVGYLFDASRPEWRVFGGAEEVRTLRVDVGWAGTRPAGVVGEELVGRKVAELDRRIAREPGMVEHRREKAGVLMGAGRVEAARGVVEGAARDFPESYWPAMARAVLEGDGAGAKRFAEWVGNRPTFTHAYYLAVVERGMGDDAGAVAAMREAMKFPVEVGADDPDILAFYLWDMGRYALGQKEYGLVVEVTDAWEKASAAHAVNENSYLALRAAAYLGLGDVERARGDLGLLESLKTRTWAKNVVQLEEAVERRDRGFRYDAGLMPGGFEVFVVPE